MSQKPNPNDDANSHPAETLAERSARLEAEAQSLYRSAADEHDPLSPEPDFSPENSADVQTYMARIEALEAELDANRDKMLRAAADAENTKRRALKERDDAQKFSISSFAKDVLPVADNLRRALEAIPEDIKNNEQMANLIEGIEATERELLRGFERHGLKKLEPMDEIFNPNFHEVMFEAPMPSKPAGTVIQVLETGYTLHERLIRPARVGVVKDDGQGGAAGRSTEPGSAIDTEA